MEKLSDQNNPGKQDDGKSQANQDITLPIAGEDAYFRQLFEQAPLGYQSLDIQGNIVEVNQAWLHALGYTRDQVIGKWFGDFLAPEYRPFFRQNFEAFKASGEAHVEFEMLRGDGRRITAHFDGKIGVDAQGNFKQTHCILTDITWQKQIEAALNAAVDNLQAFLDAIPENAFLMEVEGKILAANSHMERSFGKGSGELVGMNVYDLIPAQLAAQRRIQVQNVCQTRAPLVFEDQRAGKDLVHSLYPVLDHNQQVTRLAIVAMDVSARKELEREEHRKAELIRAVRDAQALYITHRDPHQVFNQLLDILVSASGSQVGFLDEVLQDEAGSLYKHSLALSNIAWDADSQALYERLQQNNLDFFNLNNLAGAPATGGKLVLSNEPAKDPRAGGLPPGHPALHNFMGIPLYFAGELVGVAGVANHPDGYTEPDAEFLEPLTSTCASIIHAVRQERRQSQAIADLEESEARYRRIVETAHEGIWMIDGNYVTTYVNQQMADMLGYSMEEMIGRRADAFMFPQDLHDQQQKMARRQQGLGDVYERRFKRKDGAELWTEVRATALTDEKNQFAGSFAMFTDITERKRAEQAFRKSSDLLDATQRLAHIGGWEWDVKQQTMSWTDETYRIHGMTPGEPTAGSPEHIDRSLACYDTADRLIIDAAFQRCATQGQPYDLEFPLTRTDGSRIWIQTMAQAVKKGDRVVKVVGNIIDITERKRAEVALKESEQEKALILNNAGEIIAYHDKNMRLIWANRAYLNGIGSITGTPVRMEEVRGLHCCEAWKLTKPCIGCPVSAALRTGETNEAELTPENQPNWPATQGAWYIKASPVHDDQGNVIGAIEISHNITDRKRVDEALRKSEERYRFLLESISDSVYVLDREWRHTLVNDAAESFTGIPKQTLLGNKLTDLFPGIEQTIFFQTFQRVMDTRIADIVESEYTFADGRKGWYEVHISPVPEGILCISGDITERKQMEQALKESEQRYRFMAENIGDVLWVMDAATQRYTYVSPSVKKLRGYTPEEVKAQPVAEALTPDSRQRVQELLTRRVPQFMADPQTPVFYVNEIDQPCKDSSIVHTEVTTTLSLRPEGQLQIIGVSRDITERKRAEENHRRMAEMLDTAPGSITVHDYTGKFLYTNRKTFQMHGYEEDELMSLNLHQLDVPESEALIDERMRLIQKTGEAAFEVAHYRKDRSTFPLEVYAKKVVWDGKDAILSIATDITERKQAEEKIHTALREKETLMREIHHRVKNNLNLVTSLLDLQSNTILDEQAQRAFLDSQSRIRAIARLHEAIYRSADLARIDPGDYLQDLCHHLMIAYARKQDNISLLVDIEPLWLDLDTAIPCGLILNELVSNALKHAFPPGWQVGESGVCHPEVRVSLRRVDDLLELEVTDNGIGIPPEVDIAAISTLGLQLVSLFAQQLEGKFELQRLTRGSRFCVSFPTPVAVEG